MFDPGFLNMILLFHALFELISGFNTEGVWYLKLDFRTFIVFFINMFRTLEQSQNMGLDFCVGTYPKSTCDSGL